MDTLRRIRTAHYLAAAGLFIFFFYAAVSSPPKQYPARGIVSVRQGAGLFEVAQTLKEDGVIRNAAWFRTVAVLLGGSHKLQSGDYYLPYPQSVYTIAWRVVHGDHEIQLVKVTVPEGYSARKISALFDERFTLFNKREFVSLAPEGYLFPDTYFIGVNASATSTIKLMRDNFDTHIFPLTGDIALSGHTLSEIVIMASILEREAVNKTDREIISGILWRRIALGMPLQVDATLAYLNGKTSAEMTQGDLAVSSPYNTYVYKGLPPAPISNPGLESIEAAIHPAATQYLYFLTGKDGKMYYARTFDEHKQNIQKHL